MSMPFYVAPEQQMKDRADYARKGIARGRSVIVLRYADGISVIVNMNSNEASDPADGEAVASAVHALAAAAH